jgi:transcriptional regulator with XRE-family HTH domain
VTPVCYDIKGGFPEIRRCPDCRGHVETEELEYSKESVGRRAPAFLVGAVLPYAHTKLIECRQCGWWAIREYRSEVHSQAHSEDLVVSWPAGRSPGPEGRTNGLSAPWQKALRSASSWTNPKPLPLDEAKRLFGSKGKRIWNDRAKMQRVEFGDFIRERRERLEERDEKYSLRSVAARVGVKPSYLSKLERGKKVEPPSKETIMRLADALHLNIETLLYRGVGNLDQDLHAKLKRVLLEPAGLFG